MPKAPAPPELLDRILENSGAEHFDLPPLVIAKDAGPTPLQRLLEWISSFFPKPKNTPSVGDWLGTVLQAIAILGAIMIVVAIASMFIHWIKRTRQEARDAKFGLKHGQDRLPPREKLQAELEDALRDGRTSEASRLRWKLYLMRTRLPGSITPGETEEYGRYYPLMFGATQGEAALRLFNELDASLRARESGYSQVRT